MIALMMVLAAQAAQPGQTGSQEVRVSPDSCVLEEGRWVCRYQMPALEVVPADSRLAPGTVTISPPPTVIAAPTTPPASAGAATAVGGVLTDSESRLVARCADASWLSLCLPNDRREARALRDKQAAYEAVRLEVTRMLADRRCDDAVREALEAGHLNLAQQARAFCALPAGRGAAAAGG